MNDRGHYRHVQVGSALVHTLELKQRYDNVNAATVQALLHDLSSVGVASTLGTNRWEIALKDGAWAILTWYPEWSSLEVTISDRELRRVDQSAPFRQRYQEILAKITPQLRTYGATTVGAATYSGQESLFGHTPGDVEDELDQLHNEMQCFGQEVIELLKPLEGQAAASVQRARDEEIAAWKVTESFRPLVDEVYRIEKRLNDAGVDKRTTAIWRDSIPPYANIVMVALGNNEGLKQQFIAAKTALDKTMPKAERSAAVNRARELSDARAELERRAQGNFPLVQWKRSTWDPFFAGWMRFRSEKKDVPLQTWPLSGTWDRIQDYRRQFSELYNKAPFKPTCPSPLAPRKDPSVTEIFGNVGSLLKWGLIGGLAIGGVVLLSSVASNLRSGKDPGEKYMELIRERRSRTPRALPPARRQRALPPGEET